MFDQALKVILRHEGGYVNDPHDPGGMTNLGVTRRVWEAWVGRAASEADMRGLTPEKVGPLYRAKYWNALRCDDLPPAVALCVFDFGVNAGINRGARYLQLVVGVIDDGHIGPATLAAVNAFTAKNGVPALVRQYQNGRRGYYKSLKQFPRYGKGWLRRVDETETEALRLC